MAIANKKQKAPASSISSGGLRFAQPFKVEVKEPEALNEQLVCSIPSADIATCAEKSNAADLTMDSTDRHG